MQTIKDKLSSSLSLKQYIIYIPHNGTLFCVLQIHAGVNHLGHFLLVNLLRSHGNPRVVVVSSGLSGSGIQNYVIYLQTHFIRVFGLRFVLRYLLNELFKCNKDKTLELADNN